MATPDPIATPPPKNTAKQWLPFRASSSADVGGGPRLSLRGK